MVEGEERRLLLAISRRKEKGQSAANETARLRDKQRQVAKLKPRRDRNRGASDADDRLAGKRF